MADAPINGASDVASPRRGPPLTVLSQYLKDLSFENPNAPAIFADGAEPPDGQAQVEVQARQLGAATYEVLLKLHVEATRKGQVAYILEVEYGGVFEVGDVPPDRVEALVMIEGPRLLFPFARSVVALTVAESGFSRLSVSPIDFAAVYRQQRQRLREQAAAEAAPQAIS
jgi:preprotein translocase subunit SecB